MSLEKKEYIFDSKLAQFSFYSSTLLAIIYIYLFLWNRVGISYLVFSALLAIVSSLPALLKWVKVDKNFIWRFLSLTAVLLGASAVFFLRINEVVTSWTFVFTPFLYSLLVLDAYHPEAINKWGIFYLLKLPFIVIWQWIAKSFNFIRNFKIPVLPEKAKSILGRVILGLIVAFPFVIIFAGLLSSGNHEFGQMLEDLWNKFFSLWFDDFSQFIEFIGKLIVGFFVGLHIVVWNYFSWVKESALAERFSRIKDFDDESVKKNWDYLVVTVFLFAINALFGLYVFTQIGYFFGGTENILSDSNNFTYAEYARRGFGELVVVSALSYMILLFVNLKAELVTKFSKIAYRLNATLLGLFTLAIGASAVERILILQDAYGATELRFNAMVWTIGIGVLILSVIVSAWFKNYVRYTSLTLSFVAMGILVFYAAFPTDLYLARANYARFQEQGLIDLPYILNLSDEALPVMIDLYEDENLPAEGRALVYSEFVERNSEYKSKVEGKWMSWKIFQKKHYEKVNKALEEGVDLNSEQILRDFLDGYTEALLSEDYETAYKMYWSQNTKPVDLSDLEKITITDVGYEKSGGYESWDTVNYRAYDYRDYWNGMSVYGEINYTRDDEFGWRESICKDELLYLKVENGEWKIVGSTGIVLGVEGRAYDYYGDNSHLFEGDSTCGSYFLDY